MTKTKEFKKFEDLARQVFSVPHGAVKAKLNAEKKAKERNKVKKSSASREASGPV